jgi:hypothetical protein
MTWHDLLFAHWPVAPDALRALLPRTDPPLELDVRDGFAWLGVVPFRMSGARFRWLPPVPGTAAFPELNVRTYVTAGGRPGVWFFSLDAASPLAVRAARATFHLPYFDAGMACEADGDGVYYRSRRTHAGGGALGWCRRVMRGGGCFHLTAGMPVRCPRRNPAWHLTRPSRSGCHRGVPRGGSLSWGAIMLPLPSISAVGGEEQDRRQAQDRAAR